MVLDRSRRGVSVRQFPMIIIHRWRQHEHWKLLTCRIWRQVTIIWWWCYLWKLTWWLQVIHVEVLYISWMVSCQSAVIRQTHRQTYALTMPASCALDPLYSLQYPLLTSFLSHSFQLLKLNTNKPMLESYQWNNAVQRNSLTGHHIQQAYGSTNQLQMQSIYQSINQSINALLFRWPEQNWVYRGKYNK